MQIRCAGCARTVAIADTGVLPERCPHCQQAPTPTRLGNFQVERLLAAGGMGEVYLARHVDLGTPVAIKLLPPPIGDDAAGMRQRFAREAQLQARLDHPGIVRVLDCDVLGDRPWLLLEYVAGPSLRQLLQAGPLPVAEAARLCAETADVLAAAHAQGVLHRDIKPENVLRGSDGRVRVLDFGIARARGDAAPITRTGEILGTPEYMAPEQLLDAGEAIDERTDVHALGVLAYELLTGTSPFHGANLFAVLKLVESLVPKAPSAVRPGIPAALDAVVARALAKDRAQRWPSAAAFAAALRDAAAAAAPAAPTPAARRHWPSVLSLAAIAVAATVLLLRPEADAPTPTATPPAAVLERLLAPKVLSPDQEAALRAALRQADAEVPRALRGRARLRLGEFHAAVTDLDAAAGPATAPAAQLAWLGAHVALPLAIGAPAWWRECDRDRRDRLFGLTGEPLPTSDPALAAARALALGDPAAAWAHVAPTLATTPTPPWPATLALLAAHAACPDPGALRTVHERLLAADPFVRSLLAIRLATADAAGRAQALRNLAAQMPTDGPDRWLLTLLAFACDGQRIDDAWATAEMAWLHGAGEVAALWLCGATLRAGLPGPNLAERRHDERLWNLLQRTDDGDAPAALVWRTLLLARLQGPEQAVRGLTWPATVPATLQFLRSWQQRLGDGGAARTIAATTLGLLAAQPPGDGLAAVPPGEPLAGAAALLRAWSDTAADGPTLAAWLGQALTSPPWDHVHQLPPPPPEQRERLHRAAATAIAAAPAADPLPLLRALVAAGVEPDFAAAPWSRFAGGKDRDRWIAEVCHGIR